MFKRLTQWKFARMAKYMTAKVRKEYKIHGFAEDRFVVVISLHDVPILTFSWPHEMISTEASVKGNENE